MKNFPAKNNISPITKSACIKPDISIRAAFSKCAIEISWITEISYAWTPMIT